MKDIKLVILAGGLGTRLSEETDLKPKPMIEIGGKPILWHIMKYYSHFGINNFIICCGYKGYVIKDYFSNYFKLNSDLTFDMVKNQMTIHEKRVEPWKVTLVDTGLESMTGGRLKRVQNYIKNDKLFCFTYGDGLSDINIDKLVKFHKAHGKLATLSAVYPPGRFGALEIDNNNVILDFKEKPRGDGALINGGFFVLSPKVIDLISDDTCVWEQEPLNSLAKSKQLLAYKHYGFWHPMDTLRDKNHLQNLWNSQKSPWKIW